MIYIIFQFVKFFEEKKLCEFSQVVLRTTTKLFNLLKTCWMQTLRLVCTFKFYLAKLVNFAPF